MNDFGWQHYILGGKDGHELLPVDVVTWGGWFEKAGRDRSRFVAQTSQMTPDGEVVLVSTVFIGLGTDELFETLVFGGERDQDQYRWSSWDEAVAGHEQLCRELFGCDGDGTI